MLRAATRNFLVLSLLLSLGGSWHLLQVLTWAEMIKERIPIMGFSNAIESVVAGTEPCARCIALRETRRDQEKLPITPTESQQKLIPSGAGRLTQQQLAPTPVRAPVSHALETVPDTLNAAPPSPPPELVA